MYKRTLTYEDFNGLERKEDFYFNLSKAELLEMQYGTEGSFAGILQRIIDAKDMPSIIREMKGILLKAYGRKSEDGRHFIKNDKVREEFECSEAYSILFTELSTDDEKAAEFLMGIMPKDIAAALKNEPELKALNSDSAAGLMPMT